MARGKWKLRWWACRFRLPERPFLDRSPYFLDIPPTRPVYDSVHINDWSLLCSGSMIEWRNQMWFPGHKFRGGGIFWIFALLFLFGKLGEAGLPGFVLLIIFFWVCVPWFFGVGRRAANPHPRRKARPRIYPEEIPVREARPAPAPSKAHTKLVETRRRDLSGLPAHCRACGGPADTTTVRWRGEYPVCGYCGSGLRS